MYIGSSINYKARWYAHKHTLTNGKHHSFVLQKAWDKYGQDSFEFKVLLVCSLDMRYFYEQLLMKLQSYNVYRTANECGIRGGWNHSDAFKAKMSMLHKGKKLTLEHREKISVASSGRKYNELFKEKARARQLGVSPSKVTREKLSCALKNHHAKSTKDRDELVKDIYANYKYGDSLVDILKTKNILTGTFYNACRELNLVPVKKKAVNDLLTEINKFIDSGETLKEACARLNVNYSAVKPLCNARTIR